MTVYDKPMMIQYRDGEKNQWICVRRMHAYVNRTSSDEYTGAGSDRSTHTLSFRVRYHHDLEQIAFNMQRYRIGYKDRFFRIASYDDFLEQHKQVTFVGVSYE